MNIEVVEGAVKLNAITLLTDNDDVKIVNVEALSKYYTIDTGVYYSGNGNDTPYIRLITNENTKNVSKLTNNTEIKFHMNDFFMSPVDSDARYDFDVLFTKFDVANSTVLWSHNSN